MESLIDSKLFWLLLLFTIIGEFFIPWLLKSHYPGYNSKTMVMSVLGSPASPVRKIYNSWLIWLGCFLVITAFVFFYKTKTTSSFLAGMIFVSVLTFAVGAGLLSGIFSVNETKEMTTAASKIHGIGAAVGFMTLLFFPLLNGITAFQQKDSILGSLCVAAFILAFIFFVLFIMADKKQFHHTVISYEGLWERLTLFAMYFPFLYQAIEKLFA